jgi:hypothetical protein
MIDQVVASIATDKIVVIMDDVSRFFFERKNIEYFSLQQIWVVVHEVVNMVMIMDMVIHVREMIEEEKEAVVVVVVAVIIIDKDSVIVIKMMRIVRTVE